MKAGDRAADCAHQNGRAPARAAVGVGDSGDADPDQRATGATVRGACSLSAGDHAALHHVRCHEE